MKSLRYLFRYGPGPSSSHTIAPFQAAKRFQKTMKEPFDNVEVRLYGSLALTSGGHGTEKAIERAFAGVPVRFICDAKTRVAHPLTMDFIAKKGDEEVAMRRYLSLGGGEVYSADDPSENEKDIYPFRDLSDVKTFMAKNGIRDIKDFCLRFEDPSIDDYLMESLKKMFACIESGLQKEGKIPANNNPKLQLYRSAKSVYESACSLTEEDGKKAILLASYAYAVAENSACGEEIVTSPTCGSSGVLPACLYFYYKNRGIGLEKCRDSLYAAGIFGNIVKQNASIAGSIGGCQAEIGTASSMAAAALSYCDGLSFHQMEYAAECAMEHFLGLSCDPVDGYVLIPCIERNGMGSIRADTAYLYAKHIAPVRKNQVSFDDVVKAMKLTGDSLSIAYKETAEGGLAEILGKHKDNEPAK